MHDQLTATLMLKNILLCTGYIKKYNGPETKKTCSGLLLDDQDCIFSPLSKHERERERAHGRSIFSITDCFAYGAS